MVRHAFTHFPRPTRRRGFTLLELCIVLFIMALLAGAAMPALRTAFIEQGLSGDAHHFSMMVKTAMITSSEQGRPYIISVDGRKVTLAPAAAFSSVSQATDDSDKPDAALEDVSQMQTLGNMLKLPDAEKKSAWNTLPSVSWTFEPNALCPLPRVRLEQGGSSIEMSFNALTGDVEDESLDIP